MAWWWVSFYLSGMGPLYGLALRDLGFGDAVEAVLEAHTHRAKDVPERARALVDELVLWGDDASARARLGSWYRVGAEMPVIILPPDRGLDELEHVLEVLRLSAAPPGTTNHAASHHARNAQIRTLMRGRSMPMS